MTLCPICGAPAKPKTRHIRDPKTCGKPECVTELRRRNARKQGLRNGIVAERRPWVGLSHVDQYGLPGYPPPNSLQETPDESSQSIPSDAFSFSSI